MELVANEKTLGVGVVEVKDIWTFVRLFRLCYQWFCLSFLPRTPWVI